MRFLFFFLFILVFATLVSILLFFDPIEGGVVALYALYTSVFFCFFFFFSGIFLGKKEGRDKKMALRQGVLMGILVCIILYLQQERMLYWWSALITIGGICLIEFGAFVLGMKYNKH